MPVEYQCSICGEYKSSYEEYFCLLCQEIICKDCSKQEPLQYKCFKCGSIYSKDEARENFTECPKCFNCNFCDNDLEIKYNNERYFFNCPHCGWNSENQDPIAVSDDRLQLIQLSRNVLKNQRLYEDHRIYCPTCKGTLVNTLEKIINTVSGVLPKFVFTTKAIPVNSKIEIPYTVRNPRSEGAFFRLDWYSEEGKYEISEYSKSGEFDFHAPFIKMPRNNKLSIKAIKEGEIFLWADLAYKYDEIRYGIGKTKLKLGPIYIYPKVEITRSINKPISMEEENLVYLLIKNNSIEEIKQIIISEMILEGVTNFNRQFWEIKNLKPNEEISLNYKFKVQENSKKIKFDSIRAKIRFTKFIPHMYFDFVNPVEFTEIE